MIYCIVPVELGDELHEVLLRFWRKYRQVRVVVERREFPNDRLPWVGGDRRGADRRPTNTPQLPPGIRRHRGRLSFVQVTEPSGLAEDRDTASLVARFQAGEETAFEQLYRRFFPRVYEHARSLLRDPHEAENITHDVFAEAFRSLRKSSTWQSPLAGWLAVTTRNIAHKHRRKHERVAVAEPSQLEQLCDELSERAQVHGQSAISEQDVWRLTSRLSSAQREILELRYKHDLSPEEIAKKLGRSRGSVDVLHHRAMATLRARLEARVEGSASHGDRLAARALAWPAIVLRGPGFSFIRASV